MGFAAQRNSFPGRKAQGPGKDMEIVRDLRDEFNAPALAQIVIIRHQRPANTRPGVPSHDQRFSGGVGLVLKKDGAFQVTFAGDVNSPHASIDYNQDGKAVAANLGFVTRSGWNSFSKPEQIERAREIFAAATRRVANARFASSGLWLASATETAGVRHPKSQRPYGIACADALDLRSRKVADEAALQICRSLENTPS